MLFLKLGDDIDFYYAQPDYAMITFKINNMSAVKQFLKNKDMINFLARPDSVEDDPGCEIVFIEYGDRLSIQRQSRSQFSSMVVREGIIKDLLSTLKTYIIPEGSDGDSTAKESLQWHYLTKKMTGIDSYYPSHIPMKRSPTGMAFINRDIYEKDGIPYVTPSICQ